MVLSVVRVFTLTYFCVKCKLVSMNVKSIGHQIIWLDETSSTNDFASRLAREADSHGKIVATHFQSEGKGQRGSSWESEPDQNLLFSIILHPNFIEVQKQFILSKLASVSVCELLKSFVSGVSIKWPNDIYINNSKVAGILIENSFSSSTLETTIIGIGLNVNQRLFPTDLPNPTSLHVETNQEHNVNDLLAKICEIFNKRYNELMTTVDNNISADYFALLYRKGEYHSYKADDTIFRAKIFGVRDSGELILETDSGSYREFAFKEVSFVI
jgi:BirA family biotin operon repressor/biotin-[acetyl-CoA-carboxylase] ligase